jgi:cell division transport system permease protein
LRGAAFQAWWFARAAIRGLVSSPVTSGIAVVTIGVTLVLVGAFALLLSNMQSLLDEFGDDIRLTAYLAEGLPLEGRQILAAEVSSLAEVEQVDVISPEQALDRFRASVGSASALLDGLDENPLPASFEILLRSEHRSSAGVERLITAISSLAGIEDVNSGREWVEGYLRAVSLVRAIAIGLGTILALATLLIVANTIRLGIFARRDELEILSLVGASRAFVRTPFLVEGVLQGAAGGAVAVALLYALYALVLPGFAFGLELIVGRTPDFFSAGEALALVAGGAGLGLIGSGAALGGGWRS